jgi:hypothetical protein
MPRPRLTRPDSATAERRALLRAIGMATLLPVTAALVGAVGHEPAERTGGTGGAVPGDGEPPAPDLPEVDPPQVQVDRVAMNAPGPSVDAACLPPTLEPGAQSSALLTARHSSATGFKAVAATWAPGTETGAVTVHMRVRMDAASPWSAWLTAGGDCAACDDRDGPTGAVAQPGPDRPAQRGGSQLVWTGPARDVEAVLSTAGEEPPADVRLELIDPGVTAADRAAAAGGSGGGGRVAAAEPTIYATLWGPAPVPVVATRAQWGANEAQMTWPPTFKAPVKAVVFHHSASSNNYAAGDVPGILRSIYHYQAVSRGWGDIGYNVLVDKFGRLWEGRAGGVGQPVVGAHAGGFNAGTSGICVIGDHSSLTVPTAAVRATSRYAAWKLAKYGGNPAGSTVLTGGPSTKYPANTTLTVPVIYPHRQTSSTACPGEGGMRVLAEIRRAAAARAY